MTHQTVLITGASGLLGRAVYKEFSKSFSNVVGTAYSRSTDALRKVDLLDQAQVTSLLDEVKPAIIIHCAAERRPDVCQQNESIALKLNVDSVSFLAEKALEINAWMLLISTDYVFDGTNPPYQVESKPNPLNFYGRSKLQGELAAQAVYPKITILRVPILYGRVEYNAESAVNILIDLILEKSRAVKMDDHQQRFPTHVDDVARVCKDLCLKKLTGIFHFSGKWQTTKYIMCGLFFLKIEILAKVLKQDISHIERIKTQPVDAIASRPYNANLSNDRLEQVGIDTSSIDFENFFNTILQ